MSDIPPQIFLTSAQIESVREMVGYKSYATVSSLIDDLEDAQRLAQIADIAVWDAKKNKTMRMAGGKDGIDIDSQRTCRKVQVRTLERLGLPAGSTGGLFYIPVGMPYSDTCDV